VICDGVSQGAGGEGNPYSRVRNAMLGNLGTSPATGTRNIADDNLGDLSPGGTCGEDKRAEEAETKADEMNGDETEMKTKRAGCVVKHGPSSWRSVEALPLFLDNDVEACRAQLDDLTRACGFHSPPGEGYAAEAGEEGGAGGALIVGESQGAQSAAMTRLRFLAHGRLSNPSLSQLSASICAQPSSASSSGASIIPAALKGEASRCSPPRDVWGAARMLPLHLDDSSEAQKMEGLTDSLHVDYLDPVPPAAQEALACKQESCDIVEWQGAASSGASGVGDSPRKDYLPVEAADTSAPVEISSTPHPQPDQVPAGAGSNEVRERPSIQEDPPLAEISCNTCNTQEDAAENKEGKSA